MSVLKEAHALIKSGDKTGARDLLEPYLREKPDSANGWWLLANTVDDPYEQRRYLRRVLDVKPDHELALKKLAALGSVADFGFDDENPDEELDFNYGASEQVPLSKQNKKPNGGSRTLWIVLASVAACGFFACVGIVGGMALLGPAIENTFDDIITELELTPMELVPGEPGNYVMKGSISTGQTVSSTVDTWDDDGWTFQGQAGQRITIEAVATDNSLDTELYLFGPDDREIDYNDDGPAGGYDSELVVTLPQDGDYLILVSAFGSGGDYNLTVR